MKLRDKISSRNPKRNLLLSVARVVCVVVAAYYTGKAVLSGASSLGALFHALLPVFITLGIFLIFHMQKGNLSSIFSLPTRSDIKNAKRYLPLIVVTIIAGIGLALNPGSASMIIMVITLVVFIMALISVILMARGSGADALCLFFLTCPLLLFLRSYKAIFYKWNSQFSELIGGTNWGSYIAINVYVCLLVLAWLFRLIMTSRRPVPATWSPGLMLFAVAGLLSLVVSPFFHQSLWKYIPIVLLPVLFFVLCVNAIRSWNDYKKVSAAVAISVGIMSFMFLYYAIYRSPEEATSIQEFAALRGGGGRAVFRYIFFQYFAPLSLPSILALTLTAKSRVKKRVWLGVAIVVIGTCVVTFGKAGWIGLTVCLFPWFWQTRRGRRAGLSLFLILVLSVFVLPDFVGAFFGRFSVLTSSESILSLPRYTIWKGALNMFLDHPWAGVGVGVFDKFGHDYGLDFSAYTRVAGFRIKQWYVWMEAHSSFFQTIATMGLPGLAAIIFIWGIPLRSLRRTWNTLSQWPKDERPWAIALQSYALMIILYLFAGSGLGHYGIDNPRIPIFMLWLAVLSVGNRSKRNEIRRIRPIAS